MSEKDKNGQDVALEKFRDALYGAKIRAGSLDELSSATGIPVSTLKAYLSGKSEPTLKSLCALVGSLGASFINEIIEPLGLTGAYDKDPSRLTGFAAIAQMAHATYLIAAIRRHSHLFTPDERRVVDHQIVTLTEILTEGRGK